MTAKNKAVTGESNASRFQSRFINLAAVTDDSSTISQQIWCESQTDIYEAEKIMLRWTSPDKERFNGRVIFATMFDMNSKELRKFNREGAMLKEVL